MNSKDAWKDERNLDDEIPFAYDEEGECIYCENMQIIENQNNYLLQQIRNLLNINLEDKTIYLKAIKEYGTNKQIVVAIEELSELQKELCKFLRYDTTTNIFEEVADVEIMLEQLKIIFDIEEVVEQEKKFKINRLAKRLEEDIE